MKKVYIAGKVTGEMPIPVQHKFGYAGTKLREMGYKVINPVVLLQSMKNAGFDYKDLMTVCFAAISVCDAVYMLDDWSESPGARAEHEYALKHGKEIIYQSAERMCSNA